MSLLKRIACIQIQYLFKLLQIHMVLVTSTFIKLNYSINIYQYHYEDLKLLTY